MRSLFCASGVWLPDVDKPNQLPALWIVQWRVHGDQTAARWLTLGYALPAMPVASPSERGSDHKYAVLRNPSVGRFTLRGHPALPLSPPVEQPGSHDSGDNEQGQLPAHVVGLHLKTKQLKIVAGVLGTRITVSHSDLSEQQYIGLLS